MKRDQYSVTVMLSLIILFMLGYVFIYKYDDILNQSELDGKRITISFVDQNFINMQSQLEQIEIIEPEPEEEILSKEDSLIETKSVIALLIYGLGSIDSSLITDLPKEINLGVPDNEKYMSNDIINSHSTMVDISMKDGYGQKISEFLNNKSQGIYSSEKSSISDEEIESFLKSLKEKNIIYLYGEKKDSLNIQQIAKKISFPILVNDVILDDIISSEMINENLVKLEKSAKQKGYAIGMGSTYPLTIELLRKWIPTLEKKGIKIISIKDFFEVSKNYNSENILKQVSQ